MSPQEYTELHRNGTLHDTRILQELLLKEEPSELRGNPNKQVLRKLEKAFKDRLEDLGEERSLGCQNALGTLGKAGTPLDYIDLLSKDKHYYSNIH
jgi:hypothetical protein